MRNFVFCQVHLEIWESSKSSLPDRNRMYCCCHLMVHLNQLLQVINIRLVEEEVILLGKKVSHSPFPFSVTITTLSLNRASSAEECSRE